MSLLALIAAAPATQSSVEQWGTFEITLPGPATGNPFTDVTLSARFTSANQSLVANGFYDGDGIYRIRFMPPSQGDWHYQTTSNVAALNSQSGNFLCNPPSANNHGPVRVANVYHFAYADGTPFVLIGTTCYGWMFAPQDVQDQTLATLKTSPFNKVRMQLLPGKTGEFGYPYPRDAAGNWDKDRFDPRFFQHVEKCIDQLQQLNIQADLILFDPYHKGDMAWFEDLDDVADDRYLKYAVARLAAYRNVWWSLANEYGQVKHKTDADWDHFFQVVQSADPYAHLRSIHNAQRYYDNNKPWVTHACIQNGMAVGDFGRAVLMRDLVPKPLVYDEVCYEGNIDRRWGRLTGQEMVERFWLGTIAGTYLGHGETYSNPGGPTWTGDGGKLLGQSPPRLAFLRKILEAGPPDGIEPIDETYQTHFGGKAGQYYLVYFGSEQPADWTFLIPRDPPNKSALDAGMKFRADILDTWNMTVTPVSQVFTIDKLQANTYPAVGNPKITLPGRPFIALHLIRIP